MHAYEYLMRHFATESGKSKGQFYTPAEVSRIIGKVIGVWSAKVIPRGWAPSRTASSYPGNWVLRVQGPLIRRSPTLPQPLKKSAKPR